MVVVGRPQSVGSLHETHTLSGLFDLRGRTAVVTGGTRGIGLMIAQGLVDAGCRVLVTSRDEAACAAAAAALGRSGDALAVASDLSTEEGCLRLAAKVADHLGALDVLVNNAGANWAEDLETYPMSRWDKVLSLNLRSPFVLTRALLPLLEAAATAQQPSRVINIGSVEGLSVSHLPIYAYSASKAALHHLTRMLARELGPHHVTVNAVAPGAFETKMTMATLERAESAVVAATPLGRLGHPDDMAGIAVFLASRAGAFVTGAVIPVDGGLVTTT